MRLLIVFCMVAIFALGLIMVFNTSSALVLDRSLERGLHDALYRQLMYATLGLIMALLIWRVGYQDLVRLSPALYYLFVVLLILVFVPTVGQMRNGAHRWIGLGSITFQPSECVKYLLPMVYIEWFCRQKQVTLLAFCKILTFIAIPLFLVMVEPDNGTAAVIGMSLIPLFFLTKIKFTYWALPMSIMIAMGSVVALQLPYVRQRLEVYLHPELDLKGKGHQPHQAKIAAGSGGLMGRGAGGSLQKLTYLPEAQNDYIAAIYAEEFGFLGVLGLIVLYMLFTYAGFAIAMRAKRPGGCYLGMVITFLISMQAFLNLGVVSGLLPSKGVNLPFFSQGGTSLITNMMGIALLLNIESDRHVKKAKNYLHRRRHGRASLPGTNHRL